MEREGKKLRAGAPSERVSPAQAPRRDRTFLPGHAAHCPSLPDSPRGRSALRLLRASRRRLIGLTLVFASSNCSTGEADRPIQGFALMLPSPRRYAVGPNETARRPPDHSADVDSVAPVGLVPPSGLSIDNAFTPSGQTRPPAGREVYPVMPFQLLRSASCRRPGSPLIMPSRRRAKRDRPPVVRSIHRL